MTHTLHTGDCRDVMATLAAESVDIARRRIDWYAVTSPLDSMATME